MDLAEQPTTPAFTRLPTELLGMIVAYATPGQPGYWRIRYVVLLPCFISSGRL